MANFITSGLDSRGVQVDIFLEFSFTCVLSENSKENEGFV